MVAAGIFLLLAAFAFDAAPLFVPGIAFVAIGTGAPAWVALAARGASVQRRLSSDRVVEDEPLQVDIDVRRGRLGLRRPEVLDPLAGGARFSRRGRKRLAPPSLIVHDPLELACARRTGASLPDEVLVLPRIEPVRWVLPAFASGPQEAYGGPLSEPAATTELDRLAPYRPGTPASRIHWPALARGAGLLERRLRGDAQARPLVVLDARCEGDAQRLDAPVRAAASLALELGRRGGCGLLLPGARRSIEIDPALQSWPGAHARLAVVQGGPRERAPALAPGTQASRIFYVAADPRSFRPTALHGAGEGTPVVVLPDASRAPRQGALALEVAGCRGYALRGARSRVRRVAA